MNQLCKYTENIFIHPHTRLPQAGVTLLSYDYAQNRFMQRIFHYNRKINIKERTPLRKTTLGQHLQNYHLQQKTRTQSYQVLV